MTNLIALNEIVEINPRIPKELSAMRDQRVAFVPMAAVSEDGSICSESERPLSDVMKGYTYFQKGDVLLAKITPCFENGKAAVVQGLLHDTGFGSTEFHVLRPSKEVDANYLFYQVWNPVFRFVGEKNMTGTAGQKRVPTDFLKRYKIPLPSLNEQKRIAAILDKADTIRRKRQQAIKLADDFLHATFLDMFGDPVTNPKWWPIKPLRLSLLNSRNGLSRRAKYGDSRESIVLRLQDIRPDNIRIDAPNRITLSNTEKDRYKLSNGDIAFIRVNGNSEYVGRSSVFKGYSEPVYFNDHIIRLRFSKNYCPEFLSYIFNSRAGKNLIANQVKTSAGQYTISQEGIENIQLVMPPRTLQDGFVRVGNELSIQTAKKSQSEILAEKLFLSLAHRASRGELE